MADERVSVPLRMLTGNIDILLGLGNENKQLRLNGISMHHDPETKGGVVLILHGADHEQAAELGFQLRKLGK